MFTNKMKCANCINFDLVEHLIILTSILIIIIKNSRFFYIIAPLIVVFQILITFYFDLKNVNTNKNCNTYEIPLIKKYVAVCPK